MKKPYFYLIFISSALVLSYFFMQMRFSFNQENPAATLAALAKGSAAKPFQYRALIFWIADFFIRHKLLPLTFLYDFFKLTEMLSLFFLVIVFRWYLSLFFKEKKISSLLSLSIFYVLPFNFLLPRVLPLYYPYDIPSILFFTLGLGLLYKKNWLLYYPLFVIASLNRETACFLTFVYLFTAYKVEKPAKIACHCLAQLALWLAIKGVLYQLYLHNPGPNVFERCHVGTNITHLSTNIAFFMHLRDYPFFFSNFGFIWIPVIFYLKAIREPFVKRALFVFFPFFIGMMYVGNIYEIRIFGELVPLFLTAALLIFKELLI